MARIAQNSGTCRRRRAHPLPTHWEVSLSLTHVQSCSSSQELATLEEGTPPLREVREVAPSDPRRDADRLVPLVAEVTTEGHSVLVFCSTRKACEAAAVLIADLLPQVLFGGSWRRFLMGSARTMSKRQQFCLCE